VRQLFQTSLFAFNRRRGEDARRLQRLAETHVVGERAVKFESTKEREPVDAVLLVRTQRSRTLERELEVFNLAVI